MTDLPITYQQYHAQITSLAKECLKQPEDKRHDWLHETIDGHEYVIYTAKAWAVCWHSQNDERAWEDSVMPSNANGFSDIMTPCAYHAMLADVRDRMEAAQQEFEDQAHD